MTNNYYSNNNNIAVKGNVPYKAVNPELTATAEKNVIKILNSFTHSLKACKSPKQVARCVRNVVAKLNIYDENNAPGIYRVIAEKINNAVIPKRRVLGILIGAQYRQFKRVGHQNYTKLNSLAEQVAKITSTKDDAIYHYDAENEKATAVKPATLTKMTAKIIKALKANSKIRSQIRTLRSKLTTL